MAKKTIQKKFQTSPINAVTEPSLESDSTVNVPTVHAVNEGLKGNEDIIKMACFILSTGDGYVEIGNYDEWVAAGKPNISLDSATQTSNTEITNNAEVLMKENEETKQVVVSEEE